MKINLTENQKNNIGIISSVIIMGIFGVTVYLFGFLCYTAFICFPICLALFFAITCILLIDPNEINDSKVMFVFYGSLGSIFAYTITTYLSLIALNIITIHYQLNIFYLIASILILITVIGTIKSFFQIFQSVMAIRHNKNFSNIQYILKHIEESSGAQYSIEQLKQIEAKGIKFDIPSWDKHIANDYLDIMLGKNSGIVNIAKVNKNKIRIFGKSVSTKYAKESIVEYVRSQQIFAMNKIK